MEVTASRPTKPEACRALIGRLQCQCQAAMLLIGCSQMCFLVPGAPEYLHLICLSLAFQTLPRGDLWGNMLAVGATLCPTRAT